MKTYTITVECDERTAKQILGVNGKVVNEQWLKVITTDIKDDGKVMANIDGFEVELPEDWDSMDDALICPCGDTIELDGECPEGHVSPLRLAGMI